MNDRYCRLPTAMPAVGILVDLAAGVVALVQAGKDLAGPGRRRSVTALAKLMPVGEVGVGRAQQDVAAPVDVAGAEPAAARTDPGVAERVAEGGQHLAVNRCPT